MIARRTASIWIAALSAPTMISAADPGSKRVRHYPAASASGDQLSNSKSIRVRYPPDRLPQLRLPDGSSRPVRSLLQTPQALRHGEYIWDDAGVPGGAVWVRVDLKRQLLSVFRAGHEIGTAVVLFGAASKPTQPGVFPVLQRAKAHRSNLYDADMPYMLRLTNDGIAIHASNVRPAAATHGCIGVPLPFARRLFEQVRRGDIVAVVGT